MRHIFLFDLPIGGKKQKPSKTRWGQHQLLLKVFFTSFQEEKKLSPSMIDVSKSEGL